MTKIELIKMLDDMYAEENEKANNAAILGFEDLYKYYDGKRTGILDVINMIFENWED